MGANAGGANVGGVQALEQGALTVSTQNSAFSQVGGETLSHLFTVPAGHKYIFKASGFTVGSFVGTLSTVKTQIYDGSHSIVVNSVSSASTTYTYTSPASITVPAGFSIDIRITTTAWTSGQLLLANLIQDVTI